MANTRLFTIKRVSVEASYDYETSTQIDEVIVPTEDGPYSYPGHWQSQIDGMTLYATSDIRLSMIDSSKASQYNWQLDYIDENDVVYNTVKLDNSNPDISLLLNEMVNGQTVKISVRYFDNSNNNTEVTDFANLLVYPLSDLDFGAPEDDHKVISLFENRAVLLNSDNKTDTYRLTFIGTGAYNNQDEDQTSLYVPRKIIAAEQNSNGPFIRGWTQGQLVNYIMLETEGDSVELMYDTTNNVWQVTSKSVFAEKPVKQQFIQV